MPRSSRHKSHRAHKHSARDVRERSESEEERDSKTKAESGARVSRDQEQDKRNPSSSSVPSQGKDSLDTCNGDLSGAHVKKRKDRLADVATTADRWNGGTEDNRADDREKLVGKGLELLDTDKMAKSKILAVESKGSSRKREGSSERKGDSSGRDESLKRRSEKDSGRSQYKDAKERDRDRASERDKEGFLERDRVRSSDREKERGFERDRERGSERDRERGSEKERGRGLERDKKSQDGRQERSDDVAYKKQGTRPSRPEEERPPKRDVENTDWQIQDELRNPELEKELEKRIKRRKDGSGDKDKWQEDGRDTDDRHISSRDEHAKNGSYRDEKFKDGMCIDKHREDIERDKKHLDSKHRDDSLKDHVFDRSEIKVDKGENITQENHHRKNKIEDSDKDGPLYVDDQGTKYKDNRGRKRSSDENEDHNELKFRSAKESRAYVEKNISNNSKPDSKSDKSRLEYIHSDKADSTLSGNRRKSSPSSTSHLVKDQYRHSSKQAESVRRNSFPEERLHRGTNSSDRASLSARERDTEPRSLEKPKEKNLLNSDEPLAENVASSQNERTPRESGHISPIHIMEKAPSTRDRRYLNRSGGKHSSDGKEIGQRNSLLNDGRYEDREHEFFMEKPAVDDHSQVELPNGDSLPVVSSSLNRSDHFFSGSPAHLPPPPPVRHLIDSPSVLGSFEEDNRSLGGDRKSSSRYKRSGDLNMGRGQGNAWKGNPNWPSPAANGFIPFQHGPAPGGFHPIVQQYPAQSLFGVRPVMDLNHTGVPYHMHEAHDRFSGHNRPFGWPNPVDDTCAPHLQGWDGSNGVFGDARIYGRPEWEQNRHLMGNRGWEMNADMWKGQNGSLNMEFPVPQKEPDYSAHIPTDEAWPGQSGHRARSGRSRLERMPAESIEIKRSNDTPTMDSAEAPLKVTREKTPEPSKTPIDDGAQFCCSYLSKLDISHDLVHPELYNQCISLIGTEMTGDCGVTDTMYPKSMRKVNRLASNFSNHVSSSLFPAATDAVYKRAMALYKKQNEEMKSKNPPSFLRSKESGDSPPKTSSGVEKVEPIENLISAEETCPANVRSPPSDMEVDSNISTDAKGSSPIENKEQQSDTTISNAVVFAEGSSLVCEVLIPECRVNLSRIHDDSPESTH